MMSKKETAEFFDDYAQTYPYTFQNLKDPRIRKHILKKTRQVTNRHRLEGKCILDVGCGPGTFSLIFAELGSRVVGFDLSYKMIEQANKFSKTCKLGESLDFLVADINFSPFRKGQFDLVFASDLIHHIEDKETATKMIARALRPSGFVIDIEPNGSSPFGLLVSLLRKADKGISDCNRINLRRLFLNHGLIDVRIKGFSFSHPMMPLTLLNLLEPIETILEKTFLEYIAGFVIVEARRRNHSTLKDKGQE